MRTKSNVIKGLFLLIAMSFTLSAYAKKPDFSGVWKLNKAESTLNAEFSFAPIQFNITQEKNSLSSERIVDFRGEEITMKNSYTLDGKESINEGFQGSENVSIAQWTEKGKVLSILTTIEMMDGGELKIHSSYKKDRKKLVVDTSVEGGPFESSPETWIFDKQ